MPRKVRQPFNHTHSGNFQHSRANLKLNGKKIYGADGYAVRELLKVASLLRAALQAPGEDSQAEGNALSYDVASRLAEIKQARSLATAITAQGAFLYDLLAKEPENKERREQALSRPLDMAAMESALHRALEAVAAKVATGKDQIDNVAASEAALDGKLERRRAELQRAEKRLHTVQKIKPAYQSSLTEQQQTLATLWQQYVLRYRCVQALRHLLSLLEQHRATAAEEQQAAILQLIHKYEAEDVLGKLSDSDDMNSSDEGRVIEVRQPRPATRPKTRLRIKTAGPSRERVADTLESLDDIRDDDSDLSENGYEEPLASRWPRPRPATRTLAAADDDDDFADLIEGVEAGDGGDSLGSSSESELRLTSAAPGRTSQLSDNEF